MPVCTIEKQALYSYHINRKCVITCLPACLWVIFCTACAFNTTKERNGEREKIAKQEKPIINSIWWIPCCRIALLHAGSEDLPTGGRHCPRRPNQPGDNWERTRIKYILTIPWNQLLFKIYYPKRYGMTL